MIALDKEAHTAIGVQDHAGDQFSVWTYIHIDIGPLNTGGIRLRHVLSVSPLPEARQCYFPNVCSQSQMS